MNSSRGSLGILAFVTIVFAVNPSGAWAANTQTPVATAFDVQKHGFHFNNDFAGDVLLDIPMIGKVNVGHTSYGLCGGMSYAALDSFFNHAKAPVTTDTPVSGTELRSYVYNRQMDSLRDNDAALVRQLVEWIGRPNKTAGGVTGVHVLSHRQFLHKISTELDAGRPTPLVLVEANLSVAELLSMNKLKGVFDQNHQVLAVGYHLHRNWNNHGNDEWDIDVYDPNMPDHFQTLHSAMGIETEQDATMMGPTNKVHTGKFRGFFRSSYAASKPYWVPAHAAVPVPHH
jgi:hypothetical protein